MTQQVCEVAYGTIHHVLGELQQAQVVPAGVRGRVFSAIDTLRAFRAPAQRVTIAEDISIAVHKWELARKSGNVSAEKEVRERLNALADDWSNLLSPDGSGDQVTSDLGAALAA